MTTIIGIIGKIVVWWLVALGGLLGLLATLGFVGLLLKAVNRADEGKAMRFRRVLSQEDDRWVPMSETVIPPGLYPTGRRVQPEEDTLGFDCPSSEGVLFHPGNMDAAGVHVNEDGSAAVIRFTDDEGTIPEVRGVLTPSGDVAWKSEADLSVLTEEGRKLL